MLRLQEKGEPITVPAVADALGAHLDSVGGIGYLHELWGHPATAANVVHHAGLVRRQRQRRDLIRIGSEAVRMARDGIDDLPSAIDSVVDQLLSVTHDPAAGQMVGLREQLAPAFKAAEEASRGSTEAAGLRTGFSELNAIIGGLKPGNLILLAARTSMGKSAMAMNIAQAVLGSTDRSVLVFSLEMSAGELTYRLIAAEGDLDARRLMHGRLTNDEWTHFAQTCSEIGPRAERLRVLDQGHLTPAIMRAHLRREMRRTQVGLVIVDYIQLMASGKKRENQNVEVSAISRGLKILARDFHVPILALSQLNRAIENRTDQLPRLADLRDSGSLEQDADLVIFIHRKDDSETAKIIVAKQRNGPKGTIELRWNAKAVRFTNA
jgi:replicative DNA helicase